jgi:carbon-monoxide dehydrogenase medium subunit
VRIPKPPAGQRSGFDKIKRTWGHDLALVNAAAAYDPGKREVRVAIGSCAVTPVLIPPLGGVAPGADAGDVGQRLGERALEHIRPIDDVRASAEYRCDMTALLCRRLALRLFGEGGRAS